MPYWDICDVSDPQLVLADGDDILYQIGIGRQSMSGVCRARTSSWDPHVQIVPGYDGLHLVPAHHILVISTEALAIHVVELLSANTRVYLAYVPNELDYHLFP